MGALDCISVVILLGALLTLAGILSSLVALRFGAPLLLIFIVRRHAGGRRPGPAASVSTTCGSPSRSARSRWR